MNKPQMNTQEAYRELDLPLGATQDAVKSQYRRLAAQWHPDKNPSTEALARMVRINLAYEVLTGFFAKATDSATVHADAAPHGSKHAQRTAAGQRSGPYQGRPASGRAKQQEGSRPQPRRVRLTMFEAAFGAKKTLRGESEEPCDPCHGRGKLFNKGYQCTTCDGRGMTDSAVLGLKACNACGGAGNIFPTCTACNGTRTTGQMRKWVKVIDTPPGIRNRDTLITQTLSLEETHGHIGDLEIVFEVMAHDHFVMNENGELCVYLPISVWIFAAGGEVLVPLLDGARVVTVEPGRDEIVIERQGWPSRMAGGKRGDLRVHLMVQPAGDMTDEQRNFVRSMAALDNDSLVGEWGEAMKEWAHGTTETRFGKTRE